MGPLGHRWAEPKRGLEPKYFPLEDRIEFVDGSTRWKLVGFDMVPLWRPDYGWRYHVLYKGDDGGWAEWRFQHSDDSPF